MIVFHLFILSAGPFDQKLGSSLILLSVHDHSTKVMGHSYSLIYSLLNCGNISFAIFMAVLLLYFIRYIHGYMTFCLAVVNIIADVAVIFINNI